MESKESETSESELLAHCDDEFKDKLTDVLVPEVGSSKDALITSLMELKSTLRDGGLLSSEQPFEWFRRSTVEGDAESQYYLGRCYYYSIGTAEDCAEAFEWFSKSAAQGNSGGQRGLGDCYCLGLWRSRSR